ncbi:MAG: type II toxin-antitoxin system RatA family toxin [Pseudomonadota bacterium]
MTKVSRSALVSYSAQQMFDLINDIESYPLFMAGCIDAKVLSTSEDVVEAELTLGKSGFQQRMTTRNFLSKPEKMVMRLVEGPFSHFEGLWQFTALDDNACRVSLDLEFRFANPLLGLTVGKVLEDVANRQVDCLCKRAEHVYA